MTYLEAPNHLVWPLASLRAEHERIVSLSFSLICQTAQHSLIQHVEPVVGLRRRSGTQICSAGLTIR
jgi:hypothetical protein